MTDTFWHDLSTRYSKEDWAKVPSIFAQEVKTYLPVGARILELGCGQGQDGLWFAEKENEMSVLATDLEPSALENAKAMKAERGIGTIEFEQLDLAQPSRFEDETFDVVYSHLALHYFDKKTTDQIFSEIYRVLRPEGIVAFLVNSVNDPEYKTGNEIEPDYFETAGTKKRYFSASTAHEFAKNFNVIVCDENGETYKDSAKGVHSLVRFVGKK